MLLMTCKDASWSALGVDGNGVNGCVGVQLLLCHQFELARAVRTGIRPSQVREIEAELHPLLHEHFARIPGIGFRNAPAKRCDVCRLIDATKRVAYSNYSRECAMFLAQTRNDKNKRLSYDLAGVFHKYIDAVGSSGYGQNIEQMQRAAVIMQKIRDMLFTGKTAPAPVLSTVHQEEPVSEILDAMIDSSRKGLEILLGRHLKLT